jgi:formamidopyrimidine-DNA glycosylase
MPELPEVETVRRGLASLLKLPGEVIERVEVSNKKLRFISPLSEILQVKGERLRAIRRRAKYLLLETENWMIVSHLGMTGSWRIERERRKHDHVRLFLRGDRVLTYHDPRRFGMFLVFPKHKLMSSPLLQNLGPDPVLDEAFNTEYLYRQAAGRKTSIKSLIMNQQVVVGIGNIYANEALYLAGIHPNKSCHRISRKKMALLVTAIRQVLLEAIACGGTTISDFTQAGGSNGYFQNFLLVYGRDQELCRYCQTPIRSRAIVGRNSFWCPSCQKM